MERDESTLEDISVSDAEGNWKIERTQQIYCNRDLRLDDVTFLGFDMDYTLAPYNQAELDALSVELTLERMVRERGYPEDILALERSPNFAIRGLVVDRAMGNILKLDAHRHVGKVFHGLTEVTREERHAYRQSSIRLDDGRYQLIDTLFALPEAYLFAALVGHLESTGKPHRDWGRLFDDIRYCIDLAHRDGSIKSAIMTDTARFIVKNSSLAWTLHKFRSAGKRLFLLTNSYAVYSHHIMSFLLDDVLPEYANWQNYFDIVITGSKKPSFFTERQPFIEVSTEGALGQEEYSHLSRGKIYQGGNLIDFERMLGTRGGGICYIGDHIYGDIVRSKKSSAWRTVMIVQEMESELQRTDEMRAEMAHMEEVDADIQRLSEQIAFDQRQAFMLGEEIDAIARRGGTEGELASLRQTARKTKRSRDTLTKRRKELIADLVEAEARFDAHFNAFWGPIFKMGNENTLFGEQVEDYACLYTSGVSNFLNYSPLHHFRAPRQLMPHERS
jgi:5'-nucleotidase